jgi:hypothetical protein
LEASVNVVDGLKTIRLRLEERDADQATLDLVDSIIRRASLPAAASANTNSLLQLVRMLARNPIASSNVRVYNDLVGLEEQLEGNAAAVRAIREAEAAKPVPKTKKYYKDLKEREKKTGTAG